MPLRATWKSSILSTLGRPFARCTPCKSHVGLRAREFSENVTYYLCGAHHTDGTSNAIYSVHTVQIAQGCNLCGVHRSNAIRMRFTRPTPYTSAKGAIYVVYAARMRFTRCTPYKSPKGAIYVDSNANYAVHTAQLAQGALPRHAHRSLPGPLSRAPGHDRAEMIVFRTESTTFGRGILRHSFGRFPEVLLHQVPKGGGRPARQPGSRPAEPLPGSFLGFTN